MPSRRSPSESLARYRSVAGRGPSTSVAPATSRPTDKRVQGTRRPDNTEAHELQPGEYARDPNGVWFVRPPLNAEGVSVMGSIKNHKVVEHVDGTITVEPSILQKHGGDGQEIWHGWLRKGIWSHV